jgi:hypothetical protein
MEGGKEKVGCEIYYFGLLIVQVRFSFFFVDSTGLQNT